MPARVIRGPELDKLARDYASGKCAECDRFAREIIRCLLHEKKLERQRAEAAEQALNAVIKGVA